MQNAHLGAASNAYTAEPIRVLIVEDDDLHRLSLRLSLADQNICVVGEAASGPEAVRAAIEQKPAVVLMDIGLPIFDGIVATQQIKKATDARVLILSNRSERDSIFSALRAGADGYCAKAVNRDQLMSAITSVFNNGTWLSDDVANTVISQLAAIDPEASDGQAALTGMESKILNMILEGANLDGIAADLGVHANLVHAHSQRLMTKLALSRSESVQATDKSRHMRVSAEHRLSRICPRCHSSWPLNKNVCAYDGSPTKIDNLIGTIFAERYEILSVLGSGAGGTVYKAKHRFMLKLVAIKIMHPSATRRFHALQRFRHEAIASSFLTHPNIVSVLDFGVTEKGLAFMIMDYYHGHTLARFIEKRGCLTAAEALPLFIQLCDGLEYAHQAGVLHRDIKPSNVIVSAVGSAAPLARILDFGTATLTKQVNGFTMEPAQPGFVFGSPLYMSPEQCRGMPLEPSSDIYSLGCLMYEAVTGESAIKAENISEALMHQIFTDPVHINRTEHGRSVPAMLQGIIMRCLRKDSKLRYCSAAELKTYLQAVRI
jgi:serine/threonine protein kinase/DNA-binding response OmpR family regulator